MKNYKIFSALAGLMLTASLTGCEGEKELIIYDGNLPIKTSALYMVGDATPVGWNIGDPYALTQDEEDSLLFTYEGLLNCGEFKLCLAAGSWDVGFIRPADDQRTVSSVNITDETFIMHAGDPDNKWRVTEAGVYRLIFNLREWTMSTIFLEAIQEEPEGAIDTETLYMVGDATPAGWNIDSPTELEKKSQYIFVYEGPLTAGDMKAYIGTGNWDAKHIRPVNDGVKISKDGVAEEDFVYATGPDNKWKIVDSGNYRLTFDLENFKIKAEYLGEIVIDKTPIEAEMVVLIGDATPNGWGFGTAGDMTVDAANKYIFTWTGPLQNGEMKAYTVRNEGWDNSVPAIRPAQPDVEISADGVASPDFVYTTGPDDKWKVVTSGIFTVTLDLEHYTIKVDRIGDNPNAPDEPETPDTPDTPDTPADNELLSLTEMNLIGSATAAGWDWGKAPAMEKVGNTFVWTGDLKPGELKASPKKEYTADNKYIRPDSGSETISHAGASSPNFVYKSENEGPDDKWNVTEGGNYTITFDLENMTITATYNK